MTQATESGGDGLEILMGLAAFRCKFCNSPVQGDLFCARCRVGHCPFCGEPAIRLNRDPETWKSNTCQRHTVALVAARWSGGRKRNDGFRGSKSTDGRNRMILVADFPEPTVRMDTEPLRAMGSRADVRAFFGGLAPILDALNPSGWADRDIFTEHLLKLCSGSILGLTFLRSPRGSKVRCYFAKDTESAQKALEEVAERFEEKVEQWLAEAFPWLTAGTPANIFAATL